MSEDPPMVIVPKGKEKWFKSHKILWIHTFAHRGRDDEIYCSL